MRTKLMTLAAENGFSHAAPVDMNALTPRREVREMCRVVTLAREAGIRDQVKIFVGGAPISQSFCDEIGADVYTEDAAAAARAAVSALKG